MIRVHKRFFIPIALAGALALAAVVGMACGSDDGGTAAEGDQLTIGSLIPFLSVAFFACSCNVFPNGCASTGAGHDMIECKQGRRKIRVAVLTCVLVANKYVFTRKLHNAVRNMHIGYKSNYKRNGH